MAEEEGWDVVGDDKRVAEESEPKSKKAVRPDLSGSLDKSKPVVIGEGFALREEYTLMLSPEDITSAVVYYLNAKFFKQPIDEGQLMISPGEISGGTVKIVKNYVCKVTPVRG